MENKIKDSQSYYKTLKDFWGKLANFEKVLFRDIMMQSTNWGVPPNNGTPAELENYLNELTAIEKFKKDIWMEDLGSAAKRPLLSIATFTAFLGLLGKGFGLLERNSFEINGLQLEFWEGTDFFLKRLCFPKHAECTTQYCNEHMPEEMKQERDHRYYENGLVYQFKNGKEYRRYVNFGLTDRFNLKRSDINIKVYEE